MGSAHQLVHHVKTSVWRTAYCGLSSIFCSLTNDTLWHADLGMHISSWLDLSCTRDGARQASDPWIAAVSSFQAYKLLALISRNTHGQSGTYNYTPHLVLMFQD